MRAAVARAAVVCMALAVLPTLSEAQRKLPVAPPSRADSLLARGRLRAAEDVLYAAADASPRAPAARGELGRYLASRASFVIADILFVEALRFGADTPSIAQAMMAVAPFRPAVDRRRIPGVRLPAAEAAREAARLAARATRVGAIPGTPVTVPMIFITDGRAIGSFEVRGLGGTSRAVLDPSVQGVLIAHADDPVLKPRNFGPTSHGAPLLIPELVIGERRLRGIEARVDRDVAEGEIRIGIDVLWPLRPAFDERQGTMSLSPDAPRRVPVGAVQVPMALGFPGIWLIPVVGEAPIRIASPYGRSLLRASRWWWDGPQATIVVER